MESVGGYRLVRRLGRGGRADVHLGVPLPGPESTAFDDLVRGAAPAAVPGDGVPVAPASGAAPAVALPTGTVDASVAIKTFHPATSRASVGREIAALTRLAAPHLLRLVDLALDTRGTEVLVLPRLSTHGLSGLLVDRDALDPGEVVTVLAPLAAAVDAMHHAGVAHGDIRAARVLFDATGAPVLIGFGHAAVFGEASIPGGPPPLTPIERRRCPEMRRDLDDLAAVARMLLDHTGADGSGIGEWVADTDAAEQGRSFLEELQERLFDWAPAEPVRIGATEQPYGTAAGPLPIRTAGRSAPAVAASPEAASVVAPRRERPRREGARREVVREERARPEEAGRDRDVGGSTRRTFRTGPSRGARPSAPSADVSERGRRASPYARAELPVWAVALLPEWLTAAWSDRAERRRAPSPLDALRRFLAPVRPPVWWAAGTVGALLVAALVLVPDGDGSGAGDGDARGAAEAARPPVSVDGGEAPYPTDGPAAYPSQEESAVTPSGAPSSDAEAAPEDDDAALKGDDPVTAGEALMTRRDGCLRDRSAACLAGVDQPGSAALEADLHRIRSGAPATARPGDGPYVLVEELGASAILAVPPPADAAGTAASDPVTVLLMRGEDGWRIRDVIQGGTVP